MESPTFRGILTAGRNITIRLDKVFGGDIHGGNVLALDGLRCCFHFGWYMLDEVSGDFFIPKLLFIFLNCLSNPDDPVLRTVQSCARGRLYSPAHNR